MPSLFEKKSAETELAEHIAERDELQSFLAFFDFAIQEAITRDEADGKRVPFRPGTESFKLQEKREHAEKRLSKLPHLIQFYKAAADAERAERMERELGELREQLEQVKKTDEVLCTGFGLAVKGAIEAYLAWADHMLEYGRLYDEAVGRGLTDHEAWARECQPLVRPFPADYLGAHDQILRAAADPYGEGLAGSLVALAELLPDLKPVYRHPTIPPKIERKFTDPQAERGAQPIGFHNLERSRENAPPE